MFYFQNFFFFFRNLFESEVIGIKRYESKDILLFLKQKQMGV